MCGLPNLASLRLPVHTLERIKAAANARDVPYQSLIKVYNPFVSAVRKSPVAIVAHNVLPSVVNIQTEATIRRRQADPFFDPFGLFGGQHRRRDPVHVQPR